MDSIPKHGIYGGLDPDTDPHFFHVGCVHAALEDPELYGHATVDRAISITDRVSEREKENKELEESRASRLLRAQKMIELR